MATIIENDFSKQREQALDALNVLIRAVSRPRTDLDDEERNRHQALFEKLTQLKEDYTRPFEKELNICAAVEAQAVIQWIYEKVVNDEFTPEEAADEIVVLVGRLNLSLEISDIMFKTKEEIKSDKGPYEASHKVVSIAYGMGKEGRRLKEYTRAREVLDCGYHVQKVYRQILNGRLPPDEATKSLADIVGRLARRYASRTETFVLDSKSILELGGPESAALHTVCLLLERKVDEPYFVKLISDYNYYSRLRVAFLAGVRGSEPGGDNIAKHLFFIANSDEQQFHRFVLEELLGYESEDADRALTLLSDWAFERTWGKPFPKPSEP